MKNLFLAAALVGAVSTPAVAATCTAGGTVTFNATQGNPDAIQSAACFDGNNNNTIDTNFLVFGQIGWILAANSNDSGGDHALSIDSPVPVSDQTMWSILNPLGYSQIFVTFKQANFFAAFLLDATQFLSGTWGTLGPGRSIDDLSHASIYYRGEPTPSPVPVPAAGLLLLGGIAALFGLRRKRRTV